MNTNCDLQLKKRKKSKSKEVEIIKKSLPFKIFFGVMFVILLIHCLSLIYPFLWLINNSLKNNYEYITMSSLKVPEIWRFENYSNVFSVFKVQKITFAQMTFNSIWWSVGNTVVGVFMGCVVAYTFAKYQFKAKSFMYAVIMFIMIFPIYGSGAAAYKQLFTLNLYDNPLLIIKSAGGYGGFQFLMLYSFFKTLPNDYKEAAEIDGAGDFAIFLKIMIPMAIGPILALAVTSFVETWNDYMTAIIALPSYIGLSSGLYLYEQAMKSGMNYPLYFTGAVITLIPVIIIFSCFQKLFLSNLSVGGIKG